MSKKIFIFCLALLIILSFSSSNVLAAINATQEKEQINKAYSWLSETVRGDWPDGTEDSAFSLLALAYDNSLALEGKTALESKSDELKCWPATSCKIKETALAVFALSNIGQNTDKAEDWLMLQNGTPSELNWYMQIDTAEKSVCTIYYNEDGKGYNITLDEDKKINKGAGICLSPSYGNYWLKIIKDCYEKEFEISCDRDFVATLFYQKPGERTIYISSDTKKESAGGSALLKINSICLKSGGSCDYEGTAWAAIALLKDRDISTFIPYLVGYAESNEKYLPDAFLYLLTGQDDYASRLISLFKREGYWETGSKTKQYDTALALLALQDDSPEKKEIAKDRLLKDQAKSGPDEGSWQSSKRDTAFVLFSIWRKEATYVGKEKVYCTDYGYFCLGNYDCNFDARLPDYYCAGTDICCKEKKEEKQKTCSEMGGNICPANYICSSSSTQASDGFCCLGYCEKQEESECEKEGYTCRYYCDEGEEERNWECTGTRKCCAPKSVIPAEKSKLWLWILLIILILGALLFVFRKKLKFKPRRRREHGFGLGKQPPGFPPSPPMPAGPLQRSIFPRKPVQLSPSKEVEETLRSLRERRM